MMAMMEQRNIAAYMAMGPQIMAAYAAYAAYAANASSANQPYQGVSGSFSPAALAAAAVGSASGWGYPVPNAPRGFHASTMAYNGVAGEATSVRRNAASKHGMANRNAARVGTRVRKSSTKTKSKEQRVCINCKSTETPFWRKCKDGVGSLCNACGLYLAKNDAPRPALLWRRTTASCENDSSDKTTETVVPKVDEGDDVTDDVTHTEQLSDDSNDTSDKENTTDTDSDRVVKLDDVGGDDE